MEAQNTDRYNSKASGSFMSVSTQQDKNHRQSEHYGRFTSGGGERRKPAFLKEEHAGRKEGKKEEGIDEEENPQREQTAETHVFQLRSPLHGKRRPFLSAHHQNRFSASSHFKRPRTYQLYPKDRLTPWLQYTSHQHR